MEIKRDFYLNKLIRKQNNGMVKVITGIRRAGKSYLLDPIFKQHLLEQGVPSDHIIRLDLDSVENERYAEQMKLYQYVMDRVKDEERYYVLLDEIQEVDGFVSVLNSFLRKPNLDVYVTGSNSKFLSSDIITEFRGRGDEVRVYPLSFQEFMSVYDGNRIEGLDKYLTFGGLPRVVLAETEEDKREYLRAQKDNVYINDVIERNHVRNPEELTTLVEIISSSVGSLTNPMKLAKTFISKGEKISDKTVASYLSYLEDAFLIEKARRYDVKGKKYIDSPVKYYFVDTGIRNSLLNYRQTEPNHLMENVIFTELMRRGFSVDVGVVEKRELGEDGKKDYKQYEIDFVVNRGSKRYYLQSVYRMDSEQKRNQELQSFRSVDDSFQKFLITYDNMPSWQDEEGINHLNIYDFLLDDNSLER